MMFACAQLGLYSSGKSDVNSWVFDVRAVDYMFKPLHGHQAGGQGSFDLA